MQREPLDRDERLARLLKALGSPQRLRILDALGKGQPATLAEVARRLTPQPPQTSLLTHFRVLRACGLVKAERSGSSLFYSVDAGEFRKAVAVLKDLARLGG